LSVTQRTVVDVVLPNDVDDPATPSGGNRYDRRLCDGLVASGRPVREHAVGGAWPRPGAADRVALAGVLAAVPAGGIVLIDGLFASAVPEVLEPHAGRLRLVVLVHLPLGEAATACRGPEREALAAASAVVTTSAWTRALLLDLYDLPPDRLHVATPGVDPALVAPGSAGGSALLCVAAVTRHKGHDLLVEALAELADQPWELVCVGALTRDPDFVDHLGHRIGATGLTGRVHLAGPRTGDGLAAAYAAADLLVLASRGETYGMVVTEALACGLPVLATAVGGLPAAMGRAPDGSLPGLLVEPDRPAALAGALRRWLADAGLRERLRRSAMDRRGTLTGWALTAEAVAAVLTAAGSAGGRLGVVVGHSDLLAGGE
jgi:glycosyltransferase involved in cell wall biosynthesis